MTRKCSRLKTSQRSYSSSDQLLQQLKKKNKIKKWHLIQEAAKRKEIRKKEKRRDRLQYLILNNQMANHLHEPHFKFWKRAKLKKIPKFRRTP